MIFKVLSEDPESPGTPRPGGDQVGGGPSSITDSPVQLPPAPLLLILYRIGVHVGFCLKEKKKSHWLKKKSNACPNFTFEETGIHLSVSIL